MSAGSYPFGPGPVATLTPSGPPPTGVRVIGGATWWNLVFPHWRRYRAARAAAIAATPPYLSGDPTRGFYFTDLPSLSGLNTPADIAHRLSLYLPVRAEIGVYGCAVIQFAVPPLVAPPAASYRGSIPGLTAGGAREWKTAGNIELTEHMIVIYVDPPNYTRQNWFPLPL